MISESMINDLRVTIHQAVGGFPWNPQPRNNNYKIKRKRVKHDEERGEVVNSWPDVSLDFAGEPLCTRVVDERRLGVDESIDSRVVSFRDLRSAENGSSNVGESKRAASSGRVRKIPSHRAFEPRKFGTCANNRLNSIITIGRSIDRSISHAFCAQKFIPGVSRKEFS